MELNKNILTLIKKWVAHIGTRGISTHDASLVQLVAFGGNSSVCTPIVTLL